MRPQHDHLFLLSIILRHILNTLGLVCASSILDYSLNLILLIWSMISRQQKQFLTFVCGHDGSTIAHICHIDFLVDNQANNGTRPTPLMMWLLLVGTLQELPLSFQTARSKGLGRITRKALLVNNDQMKLILKEVRTCTASMSIIDGEEGTLWPILHIFPRAWSRHIEYYRDSILIVVSLYALMCISSIRCDDTMGF